MKKHLTKAALVLSMYNESANGVLSLLANKYGFSSTSDNSQHPTSDKLEVGVQVQQDFKDDQGNILRIGSLNAPGSPATWALLDKDGKSIGGGSDPEELRTALLKI